MLVSEVLYIIIPSSGLLTAPVLLNMGSIVPPPSINLCPFIATSPDVVFPLKN
jgi:hypothetical protein